MFEPVYPVLCPWGWQIGDVTKYRFRSWSRWEWAKRSLADQEDLGDIEAYYPQYEAKINIVRHRRVPSD